ncbi:DUF4083 family protein [Ectobacillus ponti]|uniref:DUF4083 family protein n=1 Tax=Ectobacillus ponti TaxID=2961894 RepID=A0AA41X3V6_9BACI|nr:DUF4083 family protein [Ectobacillus ponti]MCP8968459.1 DUF4083 family protein [Ectobacillus ponti]
MENVGPILYVILVCGLVILFCVSFTMFIRSLLRSSSRRSAAAQNTERLLEEQNALLRELIETVKQRP